MIVTKSHVDNNSSCAAFSDVCSIQRMIKLNNITVPKQRKDGIR